MNTRKSTKKTVTPRTSAGLCDALFSEFDSLRNGDSDYHRAGAVAKLAVQIINTKKLEIEAASIIRVIPVTQLPSINLGSGK